jgi:predicted PurR-regulated permease PerM
MPGPSRRAGTAGASFCALLFGVVIIACLYFAREVLVPIALAVLMSFVLTARRPFFAASIVRGLSCAAIDCACSGAPPFGR